MMDDFGLYPREEPFDPLGVMLFKALQVIAFLFFLALLAIVARCQGRQDQLQGRVHDHAGLARQPS